MKIDKNIFHRCKPIILIIIILVLIIPIRNNSTFPNSTITSKTFFFIYLLMVSFIIAIINLLFLKQVKINISKIDILLFILISFISINRFVIQSQFGFSIRFIELIGLTFLYLILRIQSLKSYIWILLAIITSGIIQSILGNLQLLGLYSSNNPDFKITGSFFNPGPYAGFLAAIFPIALGVYLFKDKIIEQVYEHVKNKSKTINIIINYAFEYISLLGFICIIIVLPATQSRAAWLSVLVSSIFLIERKYCILNKFLKRISLIQKSLLIIATLSLIIVGFLGIYSLKKQSSDGRLFIWNNTLDIIKEKPLFGIGFDRFKSYYMNYQAKYFSRNGETIETFVADNTYYAFNEWLQFIAENGFIGLVLLGILIYYIFKLNLKKEYNYIYIYLLNGLLAIGVFAFFSYPMQILPIKLIIIVLLAMLSSLDTNKYSYIKKIKLSNFILLKTTICILTVISLTRSAQYIIDLEKGFKIWRNGLNSYMYGDYQRAIDDYRRVYPLFKREGDFLMNYGKSLSLNKQNEEAIKILLEAKQYLNNTLIEITLGNTYKNSKHFKKSEYSYKKASNMIPSRFYPIYLLAKLYDDNDKKDQAIIMAKTILNKKSKIPSTTITEMKIEMKKIINKYE